MNHIYRLIWSKRLGSLVVVAETATGCGKDAAGCDGAAGVARRWRAFLRPMVLALAGALCSMGAVSLISAPVLAGPKDGVVVAGKGTITSTPTTTTIVQTTPNLTLNWNSFNIGVGESVIFNQPGSNAIALNRILSANGSQILGQLQANGQVFLINPNGILFGRNAQVNVGGLVASTLNISDADFAARRFKFVGNNSNGKVENQGQLTAHGNGNGGGYISLLGQQVSNEGIISAQLGKVALAGGQAVTLDIVGDGLISAVVDQAAVQALVDNQGLIQADGGQVLMSARSASALLETVVNHSGVVTANSLSGHGGEIRLDGGNQGVVAVSGTLQAKGEQAGERGGQIRVLGDKVGLLDRAKVDASGQNGGGTVLVGGNFQGQGVEANASFTHVSDQVSIKADALARGDGGKVILWADQQTNFYGNISAMGGLLGGNGGFVETSGKQKLRALGNVDISARLGQGGTWLLDPNDITIDSGANTNINQSGGLFASTDDAAVVNAAALGAALNGGGTVNVQTNNSGSNTQTGTITVNTTVTASGSATLNLDAQGDIVFTSSGKLDGNGNTLNVHLNAGMDSSHTSPGTNTSSITMANGAVITTAGGNLTATSKGAITLAGVNTGIGNLTLTSNGGAISQNSAITVQGTATIHAGAGSVNLATSANAISTLAAATSTGGDFSLDNSASSGNLVFPSIDATGHNIVFKGGANTLDFNSSPVIKSNDLTLVADDVINFNSAALNIGDAGTITIKQHTTAQPLQLNASTTSGFFSLNQAEIDNLRTSAAGKIIIGNGTGAITLAGEGDFSGHDLELNASAITGTGFTVTADNLSLNSNAGNIGASGSAISVVAGGLALKTSGGDAFVNVVSGKVAIAQSDLGAGTLDLVTAGAISQSGAITAGTLVLKNITGATDLATQANAIASLGTINASGQTVSLKNTSALTQSGVLTADTFNLENSATSTLTQANAITNLGALTLGGAFSLTNSANNLTAIGDIAASGKDVVINTGSKSFTFDGITVTANKLDITATGIGQTTRSGLVLNAPATLTAGAATIQLDNFSGNQFNGALTLSNTGSNAINLVTDTDLQLGSVSTDFNFALTSKASITQSGALVLAKAASISLTGSSTQDLTLTNIGNNFTGGLTITGNVHDISITDSFGSPTTLSLPGGIRDLTLNYPNAALALDGSTSVSRNLTVTAGSGISQNAAVSVGGTATFDAGSNPVNLTLTSNDFGTVSITNATNASLTDINGIVLGTSKVSGTLDVVAGGNITQSGALTVGTLALNSGSNNIDLSTASNVISHLGTITASGSSVALKNTLALDQTGVLSVGLLSIENTGATDLSGKTNVILNLGSITQSGGAFTLNNQGTPLTINGNIAASGQDVTIDTGAKLLSFGNFTVTANNLVINSNGISETVGGVTLNAATTLNASAGVVDLSNSANVFNGVLAVNNTGSNAVLLTSSGALALGSISTADKLVIVAKGDVSQTGAFTVGGNTSVTIDSASNADVTLTKSNDFTGSVTIATQSGGTVRDVLLTNSHTGAAALPGLPAGVRDLTLSFPNGSLALDASTNVSRNLSVSAGGAITQNAAITVNGTATFDAGSNAVNLPLTTNDFGTISVTKASDATFTDINGVVFGSTKVTGTLDVTAGGAITQSGVITAATLNVSNTAGSSDFGTQNNQIDALGTILATGQSFSLKDTVALTQSGVITASTLNLNNTSAASTLTQANQIAALGTVDASGQTLTLKNTVALSQTGVLKADTLVLTNTSANTVLNTQSNEIAHLGAIDATGRSVALKNTLAGTLDQSAPIVASTLSLTNTGGAVDLSSQANKVLNLGASTISGNFTLVNSNGASGIGLSGNLDLGSGVLNLNTGGTGAITFGGKAITAGGITLKSGGLDFTAADLTAVSGSINLQANTSSTAINVGGGAGYNLGAADIATLKASKASTIEIGASGVTGIMTLAGAADFGSSDNNSGSRTVTLHGGSFTNGGNAGRTITAGVLNLNANTAAGNIGATGVGAIDFSATKIVPTTTGGGSVFLTSANGFDLGTTNVGTGTLDLAVTGGATGLTQSGVFTAGTLNLNNTRAATDFGTQSNVISTLGSITATGQTFSLKNSVSLGQSGVMTANTFGLSNTAATDLSGKTNVISNLGAITQSGGDFKLNNQGTALALGGTIAAGSNNVSIDTGSKALSFGNLGITANSLTVTSTGVTQSGALTLDAPTTLNAGAGAVALTNAGNVFNQSLTITNSGANAVAVTSSGALDLGAVTTANDLNVIAKGNVTQSAASTVGGNTSVIIDTASNADVILNKSNDFTGSLTIATQSGGSVRDVSLSNTHAGNFAAVLPTGIRDLTINQSGGAVDLSPSFSVRNLAVTAGGNITQSGGALTVSGTTTLDAGSNSITLGNVANDFQGAVAASASNATLVDTNGLILGASTITSTLDVSANGAMSQTGVLQAATLNLANPVTSVSIDLASQANLFSNIGTVNVPLGTFSLKNAQALGQNGVITVAKLNLENTAATDFTSRSNAVSALGSVTQTGGGFSLNNHGTTLDVTGNISATGQNITLDTGT
ncbi:MAG: hypothetical protein RL748_3250, partial [Pseudomonadota bacterium]